MSDSARAIIGIVAAFVVLIALVECARKASDRRDRRAANDRASRAAARRLEDLRDRGFFG